MSCPIWVLGTQLDSFAGADSPQPPIFYTRPLCSVNTKPLPLCGKEQSNALGSSRLHPPFAIRGTCSRGCTQTSLPSCPLPLHFYRNHHPPISRLAGSNNLLISLPVFWVSPFQSILPAVTRPSILKPSLHHVSFLWKTTLPCWAL